MFQLNDNPFSRDRRPRLSASAFYSLIKLYFFFRTDEGVCPYICCINLAISSNCLN
ncbi:hypothetical protein HMPREF0973_01623 [Prevotella veroralis F0319]|uniref:Uncharacterized protein n=1 Tax=Prevotella veroralis F0319 TaxID=649761 RepID=C9MPT1_9BACT|nr:hypothetical protein HMPREF0973_01623 [Prevotella veroralis F0319]